jgi:hypothetical protein
LFGKGKRKTTQEFSLRRLTVVADWLMILLMIAEVEEFIKLLCRLPPSDVIHRFNADRV